MRNRLLAALFFASAATATAADTLFMENGSLRAGRITGLSDLNYEVEVQLAPPGGRSDLPPVRAKVSIPRKDVLQVEFGSDPDLDKALAGGDLAALASLWAKWQPWLTIPRSRAGKVAIAYGNALLATRAAPSAEAALELFRTIETRAWDQEDRALARQGRLRAMIATGRANEAVQEAADLAKISEDPAVLIQAKYILAQAADAGLRKLVEENPRWEEDIFVLPERERLYNEALDLYLHPYLFLGSESAAAARGLWGAAKIYEFTGELDQARELARDLVALYPETPEAKQAGDFLASLPEAVRAIDPEAEAREENSPPTNHETNKT